ncbi:MAG: hypothetical protein K6F10_02875 [Paludibacteraceae bacterium]|nr:hypothetical protein [Paludibacteraceae bacterium]
MKRLFILLAAVLMTASMMAENYPTKFLGIPIDGTKREMIKKIQAKGFMYHNEQGQEYLSGEFNGTDVNVYVATNNNKVYRVMVAEQKMCSEGEIRIRFNNLMQQFKDNSKYIAYSMEQTFIPRDEDISYEMTVNNKVYDANFVQLTHEADTTILKQDMSDIMDHIDQYLPASFIADADSEILAKFCFVEAYTRQFAKNMVWFRINEFYGQYCLMLYYDNLYNKANGEDL